MGLEEIVASSPAGCHHRRITFGDPPGILRGSSEGLTQVWGPDPNPTSKQASLICIIVSCGGLRASLRARSDLCMPRYTSLGSNKTLGAGTWDLEKETEAAGYATSSLSDEGS